MIEAPGGSGRARQEIRVGAFVLAALLAFVALVYFLGRQSGIFERQYRLVAGFNHVGGLSVGGTVRLAGVPVGRVTAIRLPEPGGPKVQVELTLVRRVQARIRADSVARIETLGLLNDKIVEVSLGSPGTPVLGDDADLRTDEPIDTAQLARQGTELLRNLVEVSGELRSGIQKLAASTTGPDLAEALRSARALMAEIEAGQGLLHRLVYDRRLGDTLAEALASLRRVGDTATRIDQLLDGPRVGALAGQAGQAVSEAREAAERLNRVLREVEEGGGLLHALVYEDGRAVRELGALLDRAGALLGSVERGEGALGLLVRDPTAAESARRLLAAVGTLAASVERAQETDSVLRVLLAEPAIAADLRDTARQLREVTGRVARGEGVLGGVVQPGGEEALRQATTGLAGLGRLADELARDARIGETMADLRAAVASLKTIAGRIEAGEGTLGGLAVDPTVYENLAAFLEGAERSLLLRALIRSAIERGSPPPGRP